MFPHVIELLFVGMHLSIMTQIYVSIAILCNTKISSEISAVGKECSFEMNSGPWACKCTNLRSKQ